MNKTSTLENIAQKVWAERDLSVAKTLVLNHIDGTKIKSKDKIRSNVENIRSKSRLDQYIADSLLYFEGHSLSRY